MSGRLPTLGNTIVVRERRVQLQRSVVQQDQTVAEVLNNPVATSDPTVTDDSAQGYQVGSWWLNTQSNALFWCVSNAAGAASWSQTNPSGAVTSITFAGNLVVSVPNPIVGSGTVTINITAAIIAALDFSGIATTPGASGTLWNNGGFLCIAP